LHNLKDEPKCNKLNSLEFEFENHRLNKEQLKDLIYEEILLYHFKDRKKDYFEKLEKGESTI
jgi:superoxide dismutase